MLSQSVGERETDDELFTQKAGVSCTIVIASRRAVCHVDGRTSAIVHGEENLDTAKSARGPVFVYRLGWRCRSSLRRKRKEVMCTDTGAPVPVPKPSLLPNHLDARRWLPDRLLSASVPVVGFDGLNHELSSRHG